jgi:hypothetical protein
MKTFKVIFNDSKDLKPNAYGDLGKFNLQTKEIDGEYIGDRENLEVTPNYFCTSKDLLENWDEISRILQEAKDFYPNVYLKLNLAEDRFNNFREELKQTLSIMRTSVVDN